MDYTRPDYIRSDGFQIATYVDGPADGEPLILIHGWPEIAYSWKPVVPSLIAAGFRVICYDLRGFGWSDAPIEDAHYAMTQLVADLEAVMDSYGIEQATIVGHDWGGSIVWHAARMISHRVKQIIGICVPHTARAPVEPLRIVQKRSGDEHYFIEYLKRPDEVADKFASNPDAFFRLLFRSTPPDAKLGPSVTSIPSNFERFVDSGAPELRGTLLQGEDLAMFVKAYKRSGFRAPMNLYRNIDENWRVAEGMSDRITQPVLMISPERDLLLPPELSDPMVDMVPNLTRVRIPDCGHWAMWDAPSALSEAILDWLSR